MRAPVFSPTLAISLEKVCFIALKAREFDVKDAVSDPGSGSNASDDMMIDVLEDHPDDPTYSELRVFINGLTEDEQIDLVALAWLGRDDNSPEDWPELRSEAERAHNKRTASYLLGMPMLPDQLEQALSMLGHNCSEYDL
ncbi:MAG: DUF3775 domain-containing protein [Xanthobacteraceae bacterium]|nr:DUF3775 domain-containing protein [Xanthobacteraceae bacterium]